MRIERSALVPFTAQRMYELVNDVARYPERFGWCAAAEIIEADETSQHARLTLKIAGMRTAFSTQNTLVPGRSIDLKLVSGTTEILVWNLEF